MNIAFELRRAGIDVNWSTVRGAIKGWSPFAVLDVSKSGTVLVIERSGWYRPPAPETIRLKQVVGLT